MLFFYRLHLQKESITIEILKSRYSYISSLYFQKLIINLYYIIYQLLFNNFNLSLYLNSLSQKRQPSLKNHQGSTLIKKQNDGRFFFITTKDTKM